MNSSILEINEMPPPSPGQSGVSATSNQAAVVRSPPIASAICVPTEAQSFFHPTTNESPPQSYHVAERPAEEDSHERPGTMDTPAEHRDEAALQFAENTSEVIVPEEVKPFATVIKVETVATPEDNENIDTLRIPDTEQRGLKNVASLKVEHVTRTHSPLRESSVPIPTTESVVADAVQPQTKKRLASTRTKKGTATTMKRAPPMKKQKVESKRSSTPLSQSSKQLSVKGNKKLNAAFSPALSARSASAGANEDEDHNAEEDDDDGTDDPDADVYCLCRKPDTGTFMIGCDGKCDDWFHGKCVDVEERDKNLIDKYICPDCTEAGVGRTTWKRVCRRKGCRQPARISKGSSGNGNGSKYCSDDCGVLFFREMASRMRGQEDDVNTRCRSTRPRGNTQIRDSTPDEDDLGARGGVLSAREVKTLLDASSTAKGFGNLGSGVLSPPATPTDGKDTHTNLHSQPGDFGIQELESIADQKEDARRRHTLLKDRIKFVAFVKQAASRMADQKSLKPKEYCGYDSRLEWSEVHFHAWRNSDEGKTTFNSEIVVPVTPEAPIVGSISHASNDTQHTSICERKKCVRHHEWAKLAIDDLRFEMLDNSDRMRNLEIAEKSVREHIAVRIRAGRLAAEGSVEMHELVVAPDTLDPEGPIPDPPPEISFDLIPDKMHIQTVIDAS